MQEQYTERMPVTPMSIEAGRQAAAELKADLAAERAEVARLRERPWWRKVLGLPPS